MAVSAATIASAFSVGLAHPAAAVNAPLASVVSQQPAANTPWVLDGQVNALANIGNRVFVGGTFTSVKNAGSSTTQTINSLFVYDKTTGLIDQTWLPALDGTVTALQASADGTAVYVGGTFHTVNGVTANYLAKIKATTNTLITTFTPGVNGWVNDLRLSNGKLYIAGFFDKLRNVSAQRLGVVDAITGKPDATFNIPVTVAVRSAVNVGKIDISPDGTRLVLIGNFTVVGGLNRVQVAVVDLSTSPASVANWSTDRYAGNVCSGSFDTYMRDVDISPDGAFFVISTTGGWRGTTTLCDTSARWELRQSATSIQPTWVDWTGGDTQQALAVTTSAVYIGGHMRWENNSNSTGDALGPGGAARTGLAALDPINGMPLTWNPTRDRGVGVYAMLATSDGLYIGDDTDNVGGEWHPRLAFFPLAGGAANPAVSSASLPGLLYQGGNDGSLNSQTFDGTTAGTATPITTSGISWNHVTGSFLLAGQLYTAIDDGTLLVRSFDGTNFGPATNLNSWTSFANATGMFYDTGRLYFTMKGDSRLYYRYFSPQSGVVGSYLYTASGNGDGFNWKNTKGLTMASGSLFFTNGDSNLHRVTWNGGFVGTPIAGTDTVVSGNSVDGHAWNAKSLLVGPTGPAPARRK